MEPVPRQVGEEGWMKLINMDDFHIIPFDYLGCISTTPQGIQRKCEWCSLMWMNRHLSFGCNFVTTSGSEKESGWLPSLWMSFTSTPFRGTSGVWRCGWSSPRSITCTSVRWMYFPHFVGLSSFEPPERANPLVLLVFPSCMSPKFPCLFFDSLLLACNLQLYMKLNVGDWNYRA